MPPSASPFWEFSLRVYRQDGVPEACLVLQDGAGADVNVVLFLLWHASEGRLLETADVVAIEALAGDWRRDVVAPLRAVRRNLKPLEVDPAVAALRGRVKQAELEAERLQQETLFSNTGGRGVPCADLGAAARQNIAAYETVLGVAFVVQAVGVLIAAAGC